MVLTPSAVLSCLLTSQPNMAGYKAVRRTNLQYMIWISWKAVILWKVLYQLNCSRARKTAYCLHRLTGTAADKRMNTKCAAIRCFWETSVSEFRGSAYWQQVCLLTAVLLTDSSSAYWQQYCLLIAVLLTDSRSAYWLKYCLLTAVQLTDSSSAYWQQFCLLIAVLLTDSSTAYWQQYCLLTAVLLTDSSSAYW